MELKIIEELRRDMITYQDDIWRKVRVENAEAIAEGLDAVERAVNSMSQEYVAQLILERMLKMHRTLQQSFMQELVKVIYEYSRLEDRFVDARNECSREIAQHMIQGILDAGKYMYDSEKVPRLPTI